MIIAKHRLLPLFEGLPSLAAYQNGVPPRSHFRSTSLACAQFIDQIENCINCSAPRELTYTRTNFRSELIDWLIRGCFFGRLYGLAIGGELIHLEPVPEDNWVILVLDDRYRRAENTAEAKRMLNQMRTEFDRRGHAGQFQKENPMTDADAVVGLHSCCLMAASQGTCLEIYARSEDQLIAGALHEWCKGRHPANPQTGRGIIDCSDVARLNPHLIIRYFKELVQ